MKKLFKATMAFAIVGAFAQAPALAQSDDGMKEIDESVSAESGDSMDAHMNRDEMERAADDATGGASAAGGDRDAGMEEMAEELREEGGDAKD